MEINDSNGLEGENVLILAEGSLLESNLCVWLEVEPRSCCRVQPLRHVASFVTAEGAAECATLRVCVRHSSCVCFLHARVLVRLLLVKRSN